MNAAPNRRLLRGRSASGFTLVEVLVAMTLLSLVMLVLGASIRSMGASAERIDTRTTATDEMRVAGNFLREVFGRAAAQKIEPPALGLLFAAAPEAVNWIGVMPPRFGAGGRTFFRLGPERQDDGTSALVLRFVPWRWELTAMPDWTRAESRVLVRNVTGFSLAYGGNGFSQDWLPTWPADAKKLPPRIRLTLEVAGSDWPPMVMAVLPLPASDGGSGRFVTGAE